VSTESAQPDPSFAPLKQITITYKNRNQRRYGELIEKRDVVFAVGSAGTGKTYLAAVHAVKMLTDGEVDRIVVCRPAVPAGGESIGYLPGEINDKMMPYLRPIFDAFRKFWPASRIKTFLEYGQLEIVPLAFMRGRTLTNTFCIADEVQNATQDQLLMLLTRIGEGTKMVLTGDPTQSDIPGASCFEYARRRLSHLPQIGFIEFGEPDVVRSRVVQSIIENWGEDNIPDEMELPDFIQPRLGYMNGHANGHAE
jgi:phosphate starvation-inducible PhoH-like protein